MKTAVTPEEISHYREQSYVIIEEFLAPEELATMTAAVMNTVDEFGDRQFVGEGNTDYEYAEGGTNYTFLQKINIWKSNETVAGFLLNPKLGKMLCQLAGIDVWVASADC